MKQFFNLVFLPNGSWLNWGGSQVGIGYGSARFNGCNWSTFDNGWCWSWGSGNRVSVWGIWVSPIVSVSVGIVVKTIVITIITIRPVTIITIIVGTSISLGFGIGLSFGSSFTFG